MVTIERNRDFEPMGRAMHGLASGEVEETRPARATLLRKQRRPEYLLNHGRDCLSVGYRELYNRSRKFLLELSDRKHH